MDEKDIIAQRIADTKEPYTIDGYFVNNEGYMDEQWNKWIWKRIEGSDFTSVCEIAAGYGRNTAKLAPLSKEIYIVDINENCLEACRKRFADDTSGCKFHYVLTDGQDLAGVPDGQITFIYSWDSMVHFDKLVVREYLKDCARIMAPGATGFIHHSNYGVVSQDTPFKEAPNWRSNMSKDLFKEYAEAAGLEIIRQDLIAWDYNQDLDCISIFRKPAKA